MIKRMVEYQINMHNRFPSKTGIRDTMSPFNIMTGLPPSSYSNFKLEFGQYDQTHDHLNKTNDMKTRSTPAIALCPVNSQNGWTFMSLETGKYIHRYHWTELSVPDSAINRMHELADEFKLKRKDRNKPILSVLDESDSESTCDHNNKNLESDLGLDINLNKSNGENKYQEIQVLNQSNVNIDGSYHVS